MGYIGEYIGDYHRGYSGGSMAHIDPGGQINGYEWICTGYIGSRV